MIQKMLLLAMAGSMGTLCRYGMSGMVQPYVGGSCPLGTRVVNVLGCFLVGSLWALFDERLEVSNETRTIILVGFMGAFTTFSAFALETGELLRGAGYLQAAGNLMLQNVLGIAMLFAGFFLGKLA